MQYRINPKNGDRLSALGLGCMRFTRRGGFIDQEKAENEMKLAVDGGINYFDTAWTYPGSETCVGKFLAQGYRDRIRLATKLPQYLTKKYEDFDRYFYEELKRLQTDHIDYYLLHMLSDFYSWERLRELGIERWIDEKKRKGEIVNIGFSYHGGATGFIRILDAYDFDFCQMQFNYFDQHGQAGEKGLFHAAQKGLPVIIMEPLRGGRLATGLPKKAKAFWDKAEPARSPAEWGLRWVWDYPEVTVLLSGMNSPEQIAENCRTASDALPHALTPEQRALFDRAREIIKENMAVPCTGCSYCMPCPQDVDIPVCFNALNVKRSDGWFNGLREYIMCTSLKTVSTNASKCIKCGRCETHCPQKIEIRKELDKVKSELEGPIYRLSVGMARRVGKF